MLSWEVRMPTLSLLFFGFLFFFSEGGSHNATTSPRALQEATTFTVPQCTHPEGMQEYYVPFWMMVDTTPENSVPAMVMMDLDLRSRYEEDVAEQWGAGHLITVPEPFGGIPPCLRMHQKSIAHRSNPKLGYQNTLRWLENSTDDPIKTQSVWVGQVLRNSAYGIVALDAHNVITASRSYDLILEDKEVYTYFFRMTASNRNSMQGTWGVYTIFGWKALIFIYQTDSEGLDGLGMFLDYSNKWSVPIEFINLVPVSHTVPFQDTVVDGQFAIVAELPIRVIFTWGSFDGDGHRGTRADDMDLKSLIFLAMQRAGLWMPRYQLILDKQAMWCSWWYFDEWWNANNGGPWFGAAMYQFSNAGSAPIQAIFIPNFIGYFGHVGHLGMVDLNLPETQERYAMNDYDSATLDFLLRRVNEFGGLPGLWGYGDPVLNIVNGDWINRETNVNACFMRRGGLSKELNLPLRVQCNFDATQYSLNTNATFDGTKYVWPYDYDQQATWMEPYLPYITRILGNETHPGDRITNQAVLWCEGSVYDAGCVIAGERMGFQPIMWSDGSTGEIPPAQYFNCSPGMKTLPLGHCEWCPAGTYSENISATECIRCPKGHFSNARAVNCTICEAGSFARESGSNMCTTCNPGSFNTEEGQSACSLCERGSFSIVAGSVNCTQCPAPLTTQFPGESSSESCVCPLNTYTTQATVGGTLPTTCISCMQGLACEVGWPNNWATSGGDAVLKEHYFSWVSDPYSTFLCSNRTGSCPGGPPEFCDGGRTGFLCTECKEDGYFIEDGECKECPVMFKLILLFFFVGVTFGIVGAYYLANGQLTVNVDHPQGLFIFVGIAITVLQIFGVVKNLQVPWPQGQSDFMEGGSVVFALDADSLPMSCAVSPNVVAQFALQNSVGFILLILVLILKVIFNTLYKVCRRDKLNWTWGKCLNVSGQICQALFIAFCTAMVRPLQCYEHPNGDEGVITFPSVLCFDGGDHVGMMIISAVVCFFFIIPFIVWCVYGCWKAPARSADSDLDFLQAYRFLLYRFRPDTWWWGVVFLFRQTSLSFATVVPSKSPHAQLFYTSAILVTYVYVVCIFWPWINAEISFLDSAICLLLTLFLLSAMQFLPAAEESQGKVQFLLICMICVGVVCARYIIVFFLSILKNGLFAEFGGDKPDRVELCAQWMDFLHACNKQQSSTIISAICKMNMFDRQVLQNMMISWVAYSEAAIEELNLPSRARLSNIPSKSKMKEGMDIKTKFVGDVPQSNNPTPTGGTSDVAALVNHEHIQSHPRSFRILASNGTPMLV